VYFEVAGVITTLILLGRFFEAGARRRSGAAIRALLEFGAKEARVLHDGVEVLVPVDALQARDFFVVLPGEKIAADGVIVEGASAIDQSMLTGESVSRQRWLRSRAWSSRRRQARHQCSGSAPLP